MPALRPAFRNPKALERDHLAEESFFLLLASRLVLVGAGVVFLLFLVRSRLLGLIAAGTLRRIRSSIVHLCRGRQGRVGTRSCFTLRFGTRSCFILVWRGGAARRDAHVVVVATGGGRGRLICLVPIFRNRLAGQRRDD